MDEAFQLAKSEMLAALERIRRQVLDPSECSYDHWLAVTYPATYWSRALGTGKLFDSEGDDETAIEVSYPRYADTTERLFDLDGWYEWRYWVIRGEPVTARRRRWMRAVLARLIAAFASIDRFQWNTANPRGILIDTAPWNLRGLLRTLMLDYARGYNASEEDMPHMRHFRRKTRPQRLATSAMKILKAFDDRRNRSAGRPQRHDLLRETGLKESTLDYAFREILKPQGLVTEREYFYEVTPRGWQRFETQR